MLAVASNWFTGPNPSTASTSTSRLPAGVSVSSSDDLCRINDVWLSSNDIDGGIKHDENVDDNEPPSFPLPGSIQIAASSRSSVPSVQLVSPPISPTSSERTTSSSSGRSGASTPRALHSSSTSSTPAFNFKQPDSQPSSRLVATASSSLSTTTRPKPSHKAFAPEPDAFLTGASAAGSLQLPSSTTSRPARPSRKVALQPGHSALDWARLTKSGEEELRAGFDTLQRITLSEVKEHKRRNDAWSVFHGKVYNITPYLEYHPGGVPELMRVAGRDGTELFMKTHGWVNAELMLEACLIGYLVRESA